MAALERRSFIAMLLAGVSSLSLGEPSPTNSTRAGIKVAANEDRFGKSRSIGFNSTTFKVGSADTQGALFAMEQHSLKPGGPPLHLHHEQDEFWYVISGEYVFQVGSERYQAQSGDCLLGPRDVPHAYAFVGPSDGRILIGFTPAGKIQEYFERPRTPGIYMADRDLYRAYGMELLGPPLSLK
jgi:mannose-6-phosphate isomerase-like protein (cupin superfamily)